MTWPPKPKPLAPWVGMNGGLKPNGYGLTPAKAKRRRSPLNNWRQRTALGIYAINSARSRGRLRPRSPGYEKRMRSYRARRLLFLERNPRCAVFPKLGATQIHHRRGRAGKLLLDERFWIPVSADGQMWIHANPAAARERGLLCAVGLWNRSEKP